MPEPPSYFQQPFGVENEHEEIMELFRRLNEGGTMIIQVTYSEANAAFGNKTIHLFDGWLKNGPVVD